METARFKAIVVLGNKVGLFNFLRGIIVKMNDVSIGRDLCLQRRFFVVN